MPRILLVEDDARIVGFIRRGLEAEGYVVDLAETGEDAVAMVREAPYSLIILDRMLPAMDGLEVCRMLRREQHKYLVLMLTARDSLQDKVEGLRGGADDYLTKPFAFDELIARMEALLRRGASATADPVLKVVDLSLDPTSKKVWRGNREIGLTAKEFKLLAYLMSHPGAVISRTRLLNNVWDLSFDPETKVVDVYIRYLRRKIDSDGEAQLIKTVRGFGYVISA
jgi:two-component system, OmpR family, response regulator